MVACMKMINNAAMIKIDTCMILIVWAVCILDISPSKWLPKTNPGSI